MESISIRDMLPEDIPVIIEIEESSYTMPWSENSFRSELFGRNSITRVAEQNSTLAGYVCVRHVTDECHLLNLTVRLGLRNKGIARKLLDDSVQRLKAMKCRHLYLEVRSSNHAAQRLYEEYGFKPIGTRKKYYVRPVEDAMVMVLEL